MVFVIYFTGIIIYGHNKSLFTVMAAVSMLPTAKYLVMFFVVAKFKSGTKEVFDALIPFCNNKKWLYVNDDTLLEITPEEQVSPEDGKATMIADLILTYGDHIMNVDYIIINRGHVFAYSDYPKLDVEYTKDYIKKILENTCNFKSYKFYTDKDQFVKEVLNNIHTNTDCNKKVITNDYIIARKILPYSI